MKGFGAPSATGAGGRDFNAVRLGGKPPALIRKSMPSEFETKNTARARVPSLGTVAWGSRAPSRHEWVLRTSGGSAPSGAPQAEIVRPSAPKVGTGDAELDQSVAVKAGARSPRAQRRTTAWKNR